MKKSQRILCAVLSLLCTTAIVPQTAFAAEETPEFPATFDLRDVDGMNFVTPVKDQGMTGTCWAHATMAASETSILYENWKVNGIKPEENPLDFSELQLTWFTKTPVPENDPYYASQAGEGSYDTGSPIAVGGTVFDRMRILGAGMGPVMDADVPLMSKSGNVIWVAFDEETDDLVYDEEGNPVTELHPLDWEAPDGWYPYVYNIDDSEDFSVDESYRYQSVITLENTNILESPAIYNRDREYEGYNENATNQIKSELMQGRAVAIAYCADNELYLSENYAHYTCDPQFSNHDVTIIGWDDSYSRENFNTGTSEEGNDLTPPEDGAWIVKNSWGSLDNEPFPNFFGVNGSGYFYLSYYDKTLSNPASFDYDISTLNATYNAPAFQYDFLNGYYTNLYSDTPDSGANVFTSTENRLIDAVSTFTLSTNADVTYQVYKLNPDYTSPVDGELVASVDKHYDYWGYKREKLETPAAIAAGQAFSVVVTVKDEDGYLETIGANTSTKFNDAWNAAIEDETRQLSGYSKAVINPGESWISEEGEWKDLIEFDSFLTTLNDYDPDYEEVFGSREISLEGGQVYENLAIKAFGNKFDAVAPEVTLTTDAETYQAGDTVTFKAVLTNPSDQFDMMHVQLESTSTGYEFGDAVPIIPAGESVEMTYDYIIQESDIKDGKFTDTFTVTANGLSASAEADVSVATETIEEPTEEPTQDTTEEATETPTEKPTQDTTEEATETPTEEPTQETTEEAAETPTEEPSQETTLPADTYSLDDLKEMALNDYEQKNGSRPESAETVINEDGTVTIQMGDESYTVDPVTGTGTNSAGEAVDLPQTGNNSVKTAAAAGIAALFTAGGAFAVFKSGIFRRKKEND